MRLRDRPIDNPHLLAAYILSTAKFHFIGWTRRHGNQVGLVSDCEELVHPDDDGETTYDRDVRPAPFPYASGEPPGRGRSTGES